MTPKTGSWVDQWVELGKRLRAACPAEYDNVLGIVTNIVDAQEVIASFDDRIPLRERRPTKRYCA